MLRDLIDGSLDLLLGASCVGCGRPGRLLCRGCAALLPLDARQVWPVPPPPGLATPWAAGEYAGTTRAMVVGHKEHRLLALRRPLAGQLAVSVAAAIREAPPGPTVLVPVPSRPSSVRGRGHDPTGSITSGAAGLLRACGHDVLAVSMLRTRRGVVDQAGLGAAERKANLAGSMYCPPDALRRLAVRRRRVRVVVCDDVLTTGATAREAQRALESVGLEVVAIAAVGATRRRMPPGRATASQSADP